MAEAAAWLVVLIAVIALLASIGRRSRGPGSAAAGAVYDMLNEDRRNALEIIVEKRAESRDPEDADGNLPDPATGPGPRRRQDRHQGDRDLRRAELTTLSAVSRRPGV